MPLPGEMCGEGAYWMHCSFKIDITVATRYHWHYTIAPYSICVNKACLENINPELQTTKLRRKSPLWGHFNLSVS